MQLFRQNRHAMSCLFWLALVCLLIQSGCVSVEHIRLYREARQDFSAAANEDNVATMKSLFPGPESFKNLSNPAASSFNHNQVQESMGRWDAVLREFQALNSRKKQELADDQLLGSSQTLQILAELRRDLCIHILGSGGRQLVDLPLTNVLAKAEALADSKDVKLFERDEFLLRSLRPMVRYEIAYINANRPYTEVKNKDGKTDTEKDKKKRAESFLPIVEQMAIAERELESGKAPSNMVPYVTMSRFIMLNSGRYLVWSPDKARIALPLDLRDDKQKSQYESSKELKLLNDRVAHFLQKAGKKETPENNLINSLGLTPDKLSEAGLELIVKEKTVQP
jgi:hypothetical protein